MQRIPTRSITPARDQSRQRADEPSPMLRLARRIREEQGVDQVRAFLAAMKPFAAPNEIKHIGEGFGIAYESIEREMARNSGRNVREQGPDHGSVNGAANGLNMIKTVMQIQGLMKNGADAEKLISMLRGK